MEKILEAYSIKRTQTRLTVIRLIADEGENPFTAADIAAGLDVTPIQTVYGILRTLINTGVVELIPTTTNIKTYKSTESFRKDIEIHTRCEYNLHEI